MLKDKKKTDFMVKKNIIFLKGKNRKINSD